MSDIKRQLQQNNEELAEMVESVNDMALHLQNLEVTENGTYTAGAGYDAIGQVTVDVAGSDDGESDMWVGRINGSELMADSIVYLDPLDNTWKNIAVFRQIQEGRPWELKIPPAYVIKIQTLEQLTSITNQGTDFSFFKARIDGEGGTLPIIVPLHDKFLIGSDPYPDIPME